ncbi:MAG: hypothetical protein ABIF12_03780 [bacterium]
MKTLNKIVLSLLLAVGISSVNLNSMIGRDGYLINNAGITISRELVENAGFMITKDGRVLYKNGRIVSTEDIINAVFKFIGYDQAAINFDELDAVAIPGEDRLSAKDYVTSRAKDFVVGRYYDLDDKYGIEDRAKTALNFVKGVAVEFNSKIQLENILALANERNIKLAVEITAGGIAIFRLVGFGLGLIAQSELEQLVEVLALAGISVYEFRK